MEKNALHSKVLGNFYNIACRVKTTEESLSLKMPSFFFILFEKIRDYLFMQDYLTVKM